MISRTVRTPPGSLTVSLVTEKICPRKTIGFFFIILNATIVAAFLMQPIVQISLDLTNIAEALDTAHTAVRAGIDWLEAGTPLLLAEGLRAVQELRAAFPKHPIVADLKTMDGGWLEAEMMAKAGATHVVVMGRAHRATIKQVVQAGRDYGIATMGDNLGAEDKPACSRMMQDLGCDYVIHHIGYDERRDPEVIHE